MPRPRRKFYENRDPAFPTSEADLAWTAGYLDAEASFRHQNGTAGVSVSNCHLPTLRALCDWYGGSIRPHSSPNPRRKNVRPGFQWSVCGPHARALLVAAVPFLREKRPQAELILSEPTGVRGRKLTDADWERRLEMKRRLAEMKRPRFAPYTG